MLLSEFRATYPSERSKDSASPAGQVWTAPLAIIIGSYENAEIIDVKISDAVLLRKLNALLNESGALIDSSVSLEAETPDASDKYTEEKYGYLTQYGTQILALFSQTGECSYISRNVENITKQLTSAYLGDKFFSLLQPDYQNKLRDIFRPISASAVGNKEQVLRVKMQHADEKFYWYQLTIHTQEQQYVCMIENINEHIQTQNTLQKARLEAELALRARSAFLANMSHELRTPLNAVIGFSQIMERGVFGAIDNPHYSSYIRHIQESGHDLLAKIEDLLEIANIDAGRVSLDCEEIYMNDLVKHVIKTQTHHASSAKVSLSYVPRGNVLLFVDRLKMQHILGHLVANAIKYNRPGGEVTIEIGRDGKNGIRLSVHDNGVGMPDLKCHDIRESLQQDNCWSAKDNQHIGIGLALTKEFIALHNGSVEISSSAGIGTTISISLPRECIRITPHKTASQIRQLEKAY